MRNFAHLRKICDQKMIFNKIKKNERFFKNLNVDLSYENVCIVIDICHQL